MEKKIRDSTTKAIARVVLSAIAGGAIAALGLFAYDTKKVVDYISFESKISSAFYSEDNLPVLEGIVNEFSGSFKCDQNPSFDRCEVLTNFEEIRDSVYPSYSFYGNYEEALKRFNGYLKPKLEEFLGVSGFSMPEIVDFTKADSDDDTCSQGVVAQQGNGKIYLCQPYRHLSTKGMSFVLMHEVIHYVQSSSSMGYSGILMEGHAVAVSNRVLELLGEKKEDYYFYGTMNAANRYQQFLGLGLTDLQDYHKIKDAKFEFNIARNFGLLKYFQGLSLFKVREMQWGDRVYRDVLKGEYCTIFNSPEKDKCKK